MGGGRQVSAQAAGPKIVARPKLRALRGRVITRRHKRVAAGRDRGAIGNYPTVGR